jgi:hypothetical protein
MPITLYSYLDGIRKRLNPSHRLRTTLFRVPANHLGHDHREDIEKAVEKLAPRELARFRAWFAAFDADQFDVAIERDALAGKPDAHADEALAAHRAGRSRDL